MPRRVEMTPFRWRAPTRSGLGVGTTARRYDGAGQRDDQPVRGWKPVPRPWSGLGGRRRGGVGVVVALRVGAGSGEASMLSPLRNQTLRTIATVGTLFHALRLGAKGLDLVPWAPAGHRTRPRQR